jgi:hypothetical protein
MKKTKTKQPSNKTIQAKLAKHAENIRTMAKRAVQDIVGIGRELTEAKKLVGHGHYVDWLEKEFAWSIGSALNFMRVYEFVEDLKSKNKNFTNLDLSDLDIAPSALYALTRPGTPEELRDEMIERAVAGEKVTHKTVQVALTARKGGNGSAPTEATGTEATSTVAKELPPPAADEPITTTETEEAPSPPPATERDDDTAPKSEGQEGEPQPAQAQDQDPLRDLEPKLRWKVIEARQWFNAARKHAQEAEKYGYPPERFLDKEVLSHAVGDKDQIEKLCFTLEEGGKGGLSTLADKMRRVYAPPAPPPMFEESAPGEASSDSTTPDTTPDHA